MSNGCPQYKKTWNSSKTLSQLQVKRAVQTQLNQESTLQVFAKTEWCTLEPELPAVLKANIVALICFARLLSI